MQSRIPREVSQQLDTLVEEFKSALRSGTLVSVEAYLQRLKQTHRVRDEGMAQCVQEQLLAQLLREEIDYRRDSGESPAPEEYVARFPQYESMIRSLLTGMALRAGDRLADYELVACVGRGGMGEVWRAQHKLTEREVALKVIRREQMTESHHNLDTAVRYFRDEITTSARLEHDNIVRLYDAGEAGGRLYYTMQFVHGWSLDKLIAGSASTQQVVTGDTGTHQADVTPRCTCQQERAVRLMTQAAHGVHYAHNRGIIHRDIKPANMMLEQEDPAAGKTERVMVADFGLAQALSLNELSAERVCQAAAAGTAGYMAPEQKQGFYSVQCDVYSLGATLIALLVGQPPSRPAKQSESLVHLVGDPARLIHRDLQAICVKCIQDDPEHRYTSVQHLIEDLHRFLEMRPVAARRTGRIERTARWCHRNPWTSTMLLALAALLVLVITMIISSQVTKLEHALELARRNAQETQQQAREAQRERERRAEAHFDAAQLAAQRGNWAAAIQQLDSANQAGFADLNKLHLEKARIYTALNDIPARLGEIAFLTAQEDLGQYEGDALLLQAESELLSGNLEAGTGLIQAAISKGLAPADEAYARSLLADRSTESIDQLLAAVHHDRYHFQANGLLCLELIFAGRRQEAREYVVAAQAIFPDDPNFVFLEAMLDTVEGDLHGALERIDNHALSSKEVRERSKFLVTALRQLQVALISQQPISSLELVKMIAELREPSKWASAASRSTIPFPPRYHGMLVKIMPAILVPSLLARMIGLDKSAILDRVGTVHPEGTFGILQAMSLAERGRLEEAETVAVRAARLPAIFPEVSDLAWEFAAGTAANIAIAEGENSPARARAAEYARHRIAGGELSAANNYHMAVAFFLNREYGQARRLMSVALEREPENVEYLRFATRIEREDGSFFLALRYVDQVLKLRPNDENALRGRTRILDELHSLADSIQPKPES